MTTFGEAEAASPNMLLHKKPDSRAKRAASFNALFPGLMAISKQKLSDMVRLCQK